MNINLKRRNYSSQVDIINDQLNDSNFQEEGDYDLNEMPKYKYEIRVIHTSANSKEKIRTPDRITKSERFTILNGSKENFLNNQKKIYISKNIYRKNINQFYKNKSLRTGPTIRFYSGNCSPQKIIKNNAFQESYKYIKKCNRYKNNNNYNNNNDYENNYYYMNNYEYANNNNFNGNNNNTDNNDYDYIIQIFPLKKCICKREINKIINDYYKVDRNNCCCCGCSLANKNKIIIYNDYIQKGKNDIYYKISNPHKRKFFKQPMEIEKEINNLYNPKYSYN
jgi:hypothetical protein